MNFQASDMHIDEQPAAEVLRLYYVDGMSIRGIARRLKMARKTVRKFLGHGLPERIQHPGAPRASLIDPYIDTIRQQLNANPHMSAPAMLERLRPLGYSGGVSILRDRLRVMRPKPRPEAFLTLDFAPGQAVQVDWGNFGFALPGVARRVSAFVMVMCYSRMLYIEFVLSQKMGSFLRCMERALDFFGGTTLCDVFDNMKTVVLEHTPHRTLFNPVFLEYARARGFAVQACNPGKGNEKGRVERPVGFIRRRFWPGRRFRDLADLNAQAVYWRDTFGNAREHEAIGKVPTLVFEHEEKALLKPAKSTPFDTYDRTSSVVTKSFRVPFDRNHYSVPWRLVGQSVLVKADDDYVHIFLGPKRVAVHLRCWDIGQDIEHPSHKSDLWKRKPKAAAGELPPALECISEVGRKYFKILAATNRSIRRETIRLTMLTELFGVGPVTGAIDEVMRTGHVGCEYVEYVLRHKRGLSPDTTPLRLGDEALDNIVLSEPDLSVYDDTCGITLDPGNAPARSDYNNDEEQQQ